MITIGLLLSGAWGSAMGLMCNWRSLLFSFLALSSSVAVVVHLVHSVRDTRNGGIHNLCGLMGTPRDRCRRGYRPSPCRPKPVFLAAASGFLTFMRET